MRLQVMQCLGQAAHALTGHAMSGTSCTWAYRSCNVWDKLHMRLQVMQCLGQAAHALTGHAMSAAHVLTGHEMSRTSCTCAYRSCNV